MKISWVSRVRTFLFPQADPDDRATERSVYERFAIPYTFKPQLSLAEAIVAAATAFLRIFLGSVIFAVCGTYALFAWSTIHNLLFRIAVMVGWILLFAVLLLLLMLASAALTRIVSPKRR